jgi:hypothetical protein
MAEGTGVGFEEVGAEKSIVGAFAATSVEAVEKLLGGDELRNEEVAMLVGEEGSATSVQWLSQCR